MAANIFRFELWSSPTKQIQTPKCGMLFSGITQNEAERISMGMVIGLHEKYQRPQVLVYRLNEDGTETLIRTQR